MAADAIQLARDITARIENTHELMMHCGIESGGIEEHYNAWDARAREAK